MSTKTLVWLGIGAVIVIGATLSGLRDERPQAEREAAPLFQNRNRREGPHRPAERTRSIRLPRFGLRTRRTRSGRINSQRGSGC